jgi:hypothetical protein
MILPYRAGITAVTLMLAGLSSQGARAQIVGADVAQNLEYQQTSGGVAAFNGGVNAFFYARAFFTNPGDFDGGSVSFPGPASPQSFNGSGFLGSYYGIYQTGYLLPTDMNTNYPTGITYTITATNSVTLASESVQIPFLNPLYPSIIPELTTASFNALQNLNPSAAITINFNSSPVNPLATFGQDFLTITDLTTNTVVVGDAGLPSTTTSVTVGAGTFTAGDSYGFELIFDNGVQGQFGNVPTTARSDLRTFGLFTVPTAVPELSTWAMMLVGLAGLGIAGHRRAKRAAAAA